MDILNKLQEIFRDVFDDETIILTNIIVEIKKDFKIDFSMEEIGKLKNVGEIVKKIEEKL